MARLALTVPARLYAMSISHPAKAARLMLEHKGIGYETVNVSPGMQAVQVRLGGFRGGTVPALRIDGRRLVGTLAISRALDEIRPQPPLFPADPEHRRAVEEAEPWGERVLQPLPRRLLRRALIAAGAIGGDAFNAADFQIGTTLRVMLAGPDLGPVLAGRPGESLARRVWPHYRFEIPPLLPPELRT